MKYSKKQKIRSYARKTKNVFWLQFPPHFNFPPSLFFSFPSLILFSSPPLPSFLIPLPLSLSFPLFHTFPFPFAHLFVFTIFIACISHWKFSQNFWPSKAILLQIFHKTSHPYHLSLKKLVSFYSFLPSLSLQQAHISRFLNLVHFFLSHFCVSNRTAE